MRVTIIGNGYVGSAIRSEMEKRTHIESGDVNFCVGRSITDDPSTLASIVRKSDHVINAAGWTGSRNSDSCETEKVESQRDNVDLPIRLATIISQHNPDCVLHHVSTGCIYGSGEIARESDPIPASRRTYLTHKITAEDEVKTRAPRHVIWRIRMPFDHRIHVHNLLTKVLHFPRYSPGRESITYLPEFAKAVANGLTLPNGVYNAANPEPVSLRIIGQMLGVYRDEGELDLNRRQVEMDTSKLREALGHDYPFSRTMTAVGRAIG